MLRHYCLGFGALLVLTGCQLGSARLPEDHAPEPTSITKWTARTELFVEFAPLVVGEATPFAVHLTDLETFQAVSEDVVMTTLEGRDGRQLTVRSETPSIARHLPPRAHTHRTRYVSFAIQPDSSRHPDRARYD